MCENKCPHKDGPFGKYGCYASNGAYFHDVSQKNYTRFLDFFENYRYRRGVSATSQIQTKWCSIDWNASDLIFAKFLGKFDFENLPIAAWLIDPDSAELRVVVRTAN